MTHAGRAATLSLSAFLFTAAGCGTDEPPAVTDGQATNPSEPEAVAALTLANGNVVRFYDFESGAMVTETGRAGSTSPVFNPSSQLGADQLSGIWRDLAPGLPVPAALTRLQDRLIHLPPELLEPGNASPAEEGAEIAPPMDPTGETLAAPEGCSNGCCDFEWLITLGQCKGSGSYSWRQYNYGWSSVNSNRKIAMYNGLACAAVGTSTFKAQILGSVKGGSWSVPESYYQTYFWLAGTSCNPFCGYDRRQVISSVNTSADQHLHTHCGNFTY